MMHKFYNANNIHYVFLSPYCKVVENEDVQISIVNCNTKQIVKLNGTGEALDIFRKAFVLNMGMKYEVLSAFFAQFDNCSEDTWQELIQGGFLE